MSAAGSTRLKETPAQEPTQEKDEAQAENPQEADNDVNA